MSDVDPTYDYPGSSTTTRRQLRVRLRDHGGITLEVLTTRTDILDRRPAARIHLNAEQTAQLHHDLAAHIPNVADAAILL